MLDITYILAVTIIVVYPASTKALYCNSPTIDGNLTVDCNRKAVTDEELPGIFAYLKRLDYHMINNMSNLPTILLLESNELKRLKVIPDSPVVARITRLSFKRNLITDIDVGVFANLPALRELDLSYNRLTTEKFRNDIFRTKSGRKLSIEYLNLEKNELTDLNPAQFRYLNTHIKILLLGQNPIKVLSENIKLALYSFRKIEVLDISHAELSSEELDPLPQHHTQLEELHLMGNNLTHIPEYARNPGFFLRILNLNGNRIQKLNATSFGHELMLLNELHLNGMETLTEIGANTFSPLLSLRKLECSYNQNLRTVDPAAFKGLKSDWRLQEISLNNNGLKDLAGETILWDRLQVLNLGGNPWNCTCSLAWLMNFTRKRQLYDPETKLGMHCEYPAELHRRSLVYANTFLKCSPPIIVPTKDYSTMRFLTVSNFLFIIVVAISAGISTYLLMKRIRRARVLKERYSGTIVKSMAKYKLARLSDYGDTQSDVDESVNTRTVERI